jgi:Na+-transporting NADH:ubiquinone oxidoreductase subunit NqrB
MRPDSERPRATLDPRLYQIAVLSGLLIYGLGWLHFDITPGRAALLLSTALLTQVACTRLWKLPKFDPKSALISGLSLCLLLRTNLVALAILGAVITIASKFVVRWNGKHIFNPTNFGLVFLMFLGAPIWVSPGQWGNVAFFGFLMACLGGLVVNRAARSDVTYAFLLSFAALQFGRAAWAMQRWQVPLHRLESGALLLFAFFMISDPKTTPNSRAGRILFAGLVTALAGFIQFGLYRTNGILWSLAILSMSVPLIDLLLPGPRYEWNRPRTEPQTEGVPDEAPARLRKPALDHPALGQPSA